MEGNETYRADFGDLDVQARTNTGAQVAGARQNVAETLVPHELTTFALDQVLNLQSTSPELVNLPLHSTFVFYIHNALLNNIR